MSGKMTVLRPIVYRSHFCLCLSRSTAVMTRCDCCRHGPGRKQGGKKAKDVAVSTRKHCNCKNSRCLKLYCECFASGRYCLDCNCVSCCNNQENESFRQAAVETILDRNPNAFRPKILVSKCLPCWRIQAVHQKRCSLRKGCLWTACIGHCWSSSISSPLSQQNNMSSRVCFGLNALHGACVGISDFCNMLNDHLLLVHVVGNVIISIILYRSKISACIRETYTGHHCPKALMDAFA